LMRSIAPLLLVLALVFSSPMNIRLRGTQAATVLDQVQPTSVLLPLIVRACNTCYYVDSIAGSDNNSGTSVDKPWRSLARVNATHFPPGSRILFKRGSSWNGELFIDTPGVSGNPVTFAPYGVGNAPIFSHSVSGTNWVTAIFIEADWVVVEGFKVSNVHNAGVYIAEGADHNIVRDLEITNVGEGIPVHGQYNLITRNYIHDLHMINNTPGDVDDYGAVGVVLSSSNNEVSYNQFINCKAPSFDFGVDGGAVEWFGQSNHNDVHHNLAVGNAGFLEVGLGSVDGARLAYNVSFNNGRFSLINLAGHFASRVSDFRVENNTIIEAAEGERGWVIFAFEGEPGPSTFLLRNNILAIENFEAVSNKSTFTHSHNLYSLSGGTEPGFNLNPEEQLADPGFVNPTNQDFHLLSSSPAIDAGILLGYSLDFDNRPVPANTDPDLGAFEYQDHTGEGLSRR